MRDQLKNTKYLEKVKENNLAAIALDNNMIAKLTAEKGAEFKGVKLANMHQRSNYISEVEILYSAGDPLSEIATRLCGYGVITASVPRTA